MDGSPNGTDPSRGTQCPDGAARRWVGKYGDERVELLKNASLLLEGFGHSQPQR